MNLHATGQTGHRNDDAGFGLIEIVVSMLILAALALAFLPLLVAGVTSSAASATLATATQLVSEKMQVAQSRGPNCADVAAVAGTSNFAAPRGVMLRVTTTTGTCSGATTTLTVSTAVTRLDTAKVIASASTIVYVGP